MWIKLMKCNLRPKQFSSVRFYAKKPKRYEKKGSKDRALEYFDEFYSKVFRTKWPSMRVALQCPSKYCAVLNSYGEIGDLLKTFQENNALNLKDIYNKKLLIQNRMKNLVINDSKTENADATVNSKDANSDLIPQEDNETLSDENKNINVYSDENFLTEGEFVPATNLKYEEEIVNDEEYFDFYKENLDIKINFQMENAINFPERWKIFVYPRGNVENFSHPKRDPLKLYSHYLMNGASVLPVFALDPQPGEIIGDFCAAPGGKTLLILFSVQFGKFICNDISKSRLNRLVSNLEQYIPSLENLKQHFVIKNEDARELQQDNYFDKILIDVPCTNDRLSVNENDNNIFKAMRNAERVKMPQLQMDILCAGLKSIKEGGSVVYSTCSLSPIQNDGVVHMALCHMWEEMRREFVISNLTEVFRPFRKTMRFWNFCKYGQLVIPFLPLNHGPMYCSKITRIK